MGDAGAATFWGGRGDSVCIRALVTQHAEFRAVFLIHLLATPSNNDSSRVLDAFVTDPTVPQEIRRKVQEAMVDNSIPATNEERMTASERLRAEGIAIGERRGEKRGEERATQHARALLVERVRERLGDSAAAELVHISDLDALYQRVFELLG